MVLVLLFPIVLLVPELVLVPLVMEDIMFQLEIAHFATVHALHAVELELNLVLLVLVVDPLSYNSVNVLLPLNAYQEPMEPLVQMFACHVIPLVLSVPDH